MGAWETRPGMEETLVKERKVRLMVRKLVLPDQPNHRLGCLRRAMGTDWDEKEMGPFEKKRGNSPEDQDHPCKEE